MRSAKPWYRAQRDAWCCYVNGALVTLAKGRDNKKEAEQEFHRLMLHSGRVTVCKLTLAHVCDLFLEHSDREHAEPTYDQYRHFLQSFCRKTGRIKATELKLHHLTRWLQNSKWGQTSTRHAIGAVKTCFAWAKEQGHIPDNPFLAAKRPPARRRERILTPDERETIFRKIKGSTNRTYRPALLRGPLD
jgi:integrase